METINEYCVILTTCANQDEADKIAKLLLENKLAACIQVTQITSYFFWDDTVNKDPECLLMIKTRAGLYDEVERLILRHHSYEVPEVVQIPVMNGLQSYLSWIDETTK